jgi:hypothetical protein
MDLVRLKSIRLHGLSKFFHNIFMILTYPLRHIFIFSTCVIIFLAVLIALPLLFGVSVNHVGDWYLLKCDENHICTEIQEKLEKVTQKEPAEVSAPKIIRNQPVEENEAVREGRQVFKKASAPMVPEDSESESKPKKQYKIMNIKKNPPISRVEVMPMPVKIESKGEPAEQVKVSEPVVLPAMQPAKPVVVKQELPASRYYRRDDTLPLVYEDTPATVKGETFVFSANEISVGNTYIILYGIYTDPEKYNQDDANQYLKELADGKMLECKIVAYTQHNIATGVCFLDGRSINQNLVDAGFADNVAL